VKWIRWIALLAGIAMFAVSFIIPAVKEASASPGSAGIPGFTCAIVTISVPWSKDGREALHRAPLQYFSMLFSGWINPVFIIALLLVLIRPKWVGGDILTYVVSFMFVFCWMVFYQFKLYPREGYFLWMFGIVLALYSSKILRSRPNARQVKDG
jgi:hypothetical protein